jgi:multisubunit Na+/H+ antiporter MnhG subunit
METKPLIQKLKIGLWVIGSILLILIIISWFVDFPKWLDQLISNIMMVGLGLVMLYKAYQIRAKDRSFSSIYLIIGITLIVIALLSFAFVKIIAVIGLAIFLLTNPRVQKIINKVDEPKNP